jgi:hypothetical protein
MDALTTNLERYRALLGELLLVRELDGVNGVLPEDTESAYVDRLDALWWQLSEEEQAAYKQIAPDAPQDTHLVDVSVSIGSTTLPRRRRRYLPVLKD